MLACRYQILSLAVETLPFIAQISKNENGEPQIQIPEQNIHLIPRIIKRNTLLFQAMEQIRNQNGLHAIPSHDVLTCFEKDVCVISWPKKLDNQRYALNKNESEQDGNASFKMPQIRESILKNGFMLGNKRMLPALSAASSTRQGKYLFLSEKYRDEAIKKVSLGITDWKNNEPVLNLKPDYELVIPKYSAYLGNADSDGISLSELELLCGEIYLSANETGNIKARENAVKAQNVSANPDGTTPFILTKKNMIVVDDCVPKNLKNPLCSWEIVHDQNGKVSIKKTENENLSANLTDGFGFASPRFFERLNALRAIRQKDAPPVKSIIIRLPWTKGLLVEMDFAAYFKENNAQSIFDRYHVKHNVDDLDVILTRSMWKGYSMYEHLNDIKPAQNGWEAYMNELEKSGFSMVIVGTDTPPTKKTRLNYQLLSTLNIDPDTLNLFAQKDAELFSKMKTLIESAQNSEVSVSDIVDFLRRGSDEDEDEQPANVESGDTKGEEGIPIPPDNEEMTTPEENSYAEKLAQLVEAFPILAKSKLVLSQVYEQLFALAMDGSVGRITVSGDMRIQIGDPFDLLDKIITVSNATAKAEKNRTNRQKAIAEALEKLPLNPINANGYCFVPGRNDDCIVIDRNPHVSAFEHVPLKQIPKDDKKYNNYQKYFGSHTGIIINNWVCCAANAGSDFDGDRVRLVFEKKYIEAVQKNIQAVYKTLYAAPSDASGIAYGSLSLERFDGAKETILPPIMIQGGDSPKTSVKDLDGKLSAALAESYLHSIDSRVGQFSIKAATLALRGAGNNPADWLARQAAWCVAIGLDIDSQKTGNHLPVPEGLESDSLWNDLEKTGKKPAIINFSQEMKHQRGGKSGYTVYKNTAQKIGKSGKKTQNTVSPLNNLLDQFDAHDVGKFAGKPYQYGADLLAIFNDAAMEAEMAQNETAKDAVKEAAALIRRFTERRSAKRKLLDAQSNLRIQYVNVYKYLLRAYPLENAKAMLKAIYRQAEQRADAGAKRSELAKFENESVMARYVFKSSDALKKELQDILFGSISPAEQPEFALFEFDATVLPLVKHVLRLSGALKDQKQCALQLNADSANPDAPTLTGALGDQIDAIAQKYQIDRRLLGWALLKKKKIEAMDFVFLFADDVIAGAEAQTSDPNPPKGGNASVRP